MPGPPAGRSSAEERVHRPVVDVARLHRVIATLVEKFDGRLADEARRGLSNPRAGADARDPETRELRDRGQSRHDEDVEGQTGASGDLTDRVRVLDAGHEDPVGTGVAIA